MRKIPHLKPKVYEEKQSRRVTGRKKAKKKNIAHQLPTPKASENKTFASIVAKNKKTKQARKPKQILWEI